jgi:3-phenylpropionate/trans-cinnamate dioxygenase ferredoxin subunit
MEGFAKVGNSSILSPGTMKLVRTPSGKRLLVNLRGKYFALAPECTHQGCSLVEGKLEAETVTCFCHFAEYKVATGEVVEGPAEEPLRTFEVRVEESELWVALDPEGPPLL